MNCENTGGSGGNVIWLADFRRRRGLSDTTPEMPVSIGGPIAASPARPSMDIVYFITGGEFETMVNGVVGVLRAPGFVRVPAGWVHSFTDIGMRAGTMVRHRFPAGVQAGLLEEIAGALPRFSSDFPRPGTPAFARLARIALRWGLVLDDQAA